MIPRRVTTLLFAIGLSQGAALAENQSTVAEQSLAQLEAAHKYAPPPPAKSPAETSPIVARPPSAGTAVADLPAVQLPAFTVVESLHARDLENAMQMAAQKAEDKKSLTKPRELFGTDLGPFRASVRFEAVHGHLANVDFDIFNLSW